MSDRSRRDQILLTAGHVFAEQGFERTTIREICTRAGVNLASVNYYFGDKETLYLEAVQLAYRTRAGEVPLPTWTSDVRAEERLRDYIRTLLARMIGEVQLPWQSRLLMREVLNPSHACEKLVEDYFRPHFELLLNILDQIVPAQTERHVRQQMAFSVIGQCLLYRVSDSVVSMLVDDATRRVHYEVDQLAEQITRFSLQGLHQLRSGSTASDSTGINKNISTARSPVATQTNYS